MLNHEDISKGGERVPVLAEPCVLKELQKQEFVVSILLSLILYCQNVGYRTSILFKVNVHFEQEVTISQKNFKVKGKTEKENTGTYWNGKKYSLIRDSYQMQYRPSCIYRLS